MVEEPEAGAVLPDGIRALQADEADYQGYLQAIAVPLGDKKAGLELVKQDEGLPGHLPRLRRRPRWSQTTTGSCRLFKWFIDVQYFRRAVTIWTESGRGDQRSARARRRAPDRHRPRRSITAPRIKANPRGGRGHRQAPDAPRGRLLRSRWARRRDGRKGCLAEGDAGGRGRLRGPRGPYLGLMISKHLRTELAALGDGAVSASPAGDLDHRIPIASRATRSAASPETFNAMTVNLAASRGEIRKLNPELEHRVASAPRSSRPPTRSWRPSAIRSRTTCAPRCAASTASARRCSRTTATLDEPARLPERVRAASRRMAQLIDDLLDLSRLARGEIQQASVDLSALARAVAASCSARHPSAGSSFVIADDLRRRAIPAAPHRRWRTCSATPGSSPASTPTRASSSARTGTRRAARSSSATTAPASTWPTPTSCSAPSSACTGGRVRGHRHRPGHRAAHHPPPRRTRLGRGRGRAQARRSTSRSGSGTETSMEKSSFCSSRTTPTT